jgi:hypothetical protein|nr:MAG TPA: hypothetical protein [Caudoviricetes sp.]
MKTQEIMWHSVKNDGMPTEEEIERTKNRFLCLVKTIYLNDESEVTRNVVVGYVENGEFKDFVKSKLNISFNNCFVQRVTDWTEIPYVEF